MVGSGAKRVNFKLTSTGPTTSAFSSSSAVSNFHRTCRDFLILEFMGLALTRRLSELLRPLFRPSSLPLDTSALINAWNQERFFLLFLFALKILGCRNMNRLKNPCRGVKTIMISEMAFLVIGLASKSISSAIILTQTNA